MIDFNFETNKVEFNGKEVNESDIPALLKEAEEQDSTVTDLFIVLFQTALGIAILWAAYDTLNEILLYALILWLIQTICIMTKIK